MRSILERLRPRNTKAARNEAKKVRATYLNGLAIALFVAGAFPVFLRVNAANPSEIFTFSLSKFGLYTGDDFRMIAGCFLASMTFHACAQLSVSGLED
ncbi:hypothetical protein [Agrobacterium fabrum]|uniref:hypothetical protein n=1 Tax=Agrobacterium fabrum TaxID=1176649 RepID=UPI000B849F61|nr:hypothetical protein [Agrobacterium fabrum]